MNQPSPRPQPVPSSFADPPTEPNERLAFVAAYKLAVGILLLAVAFDLLALVGEDLTEVVHGWILRLHADPDNPHVLALVSWTASVDASGLGYYSLAAGLFGGLHLAEGFGLWLSKHWAEYLTVVTTAALIPFEALELLENRHPVELLILALNVAVVAVLVARVRLRRDLHGV